MEPIDRKFKISAVCLAHDQEYTENDGVLFLAKDAAFNRRVMDVYKEEQVKLGAHMRQLKGTELLTERIMNFKARNPHLVKVPDVDEGAEEDIVNRANE